MEEETDALRSRSIRIHQSQIMMGSMIWMDVERMPVDWVGEHVHEVNTVVPYFFIKSHPLFGKLDRIGEWMRWTTPAMSTDDANDPVTVWENARDWIHARRDSDSYPRHPPRNKMEQDTFRKPYPARARKFRSMDEEKWTSWMGQ